MFYHHQVKTQNEPYQQIDEVECASRERLPFFVWKWTKAFFRLVWTGFSIFIENLEYFGGISSKNR